METVPKCWEPYHKKQHTPDRFEVCTTSVCVNKDSITSLLLGTNCNQLGIVCIYLH